MKKALLAFSGGLDTTYCLVYLQKQGYEVHTITVDTGGFLPGEADKIQDWAIKLGAKNHYSIDASDALFQKLITPLVKANYLRNGTYPPCVGPERFIIVEEIAKICKDVNFDAIVHGSTGAGGDQIRFESALSTILPHIELIAPIRDLGLSRDASFAYLADNGINMPSKNKEYSINMGLIGNTIGGKETLDTKKPLPDEAFPNLNVAQPSSQKVKIAFENGEVISIDDTKITGAKIMQKLNNIGLEAGFGKGYHIGTSILGLKARLGFEAPGYKILVFAHQELEKVVLTSKQIFWKNHLGNVFGDMIHEGHFYEPLLEDISAMLDSSNRFVSGVVEVLINGGNIEILSIESKYSMFSKKAGTYGETMSAWSGDDAKSFAKLHSFEAKNAYWVRNSSN